MLFNRGKNLLGDSIPLAAKAAFWFVLCSVIQKSLAFITVPIFTRIMPPEQYGLYALYNSYLGILIVLCTLNTETAAFVNGYTKAKSIAEKRRLPVNLISLAGLLTIIVFILFSIAYPIFHTWIGLPFIFIVFLFLNIIATPSYNIWIFQQRFDYKYKKLVAVTLLLSITQVLFGILFVYQSSEEYKALSRIICIVCPALLVSAFIFINYGRRNGRFIETTNWTKVIRLQLPLVPYNLSMVLLLSSSRIIINAYNGARCLAIYSVAYSIGQIISIIKQSIVDAFHPWIYQKLKNNDFKPVKDLTVFLLLLLSLIAYITSTAAPFILKLFAPAEYSDAVYVIPVISAVVIFAVYNQLFSVIMTYYEKTKFIMYSSIIACVINIVLNIIFIPLLGYMFAAISSLLSYMILSFVNFYLIKKIKDFLNPYSLKIVLILPTTLAFFISSITFLYGHLEILLGVDFIMVIACAIKYKIIIKYMKFRKIR